MKVGIVSDSHDNIENLRKALDFFAKNQVEVVLHLGDVVSPFVYEKLFKFFTDKMRFILIFGNNDGDKYAWRKISENDENFEILGREFASVSLCEKKVFITHYPELAQMAFSSGDYDAVFYGHTHLSEKRISNSGVLLLNPGEISATLSGKPSCALWDCTQNDAEIVFL